MRNESLITGGILSYIQKNQRIQNITQTVLAQELNMAPAKVSRAIQILKSKDLVKVRKQGKWNVLTTQIETDGKTEIQTETETNIETEIETEKAVFPKITPIVEQTPPKTEIDIETETDIETEKFDLSLNSLKLLLDANRDHVLHDTLEHQFIGKTITKNGKQKKTGGKLRANFMQLISFLKDVT